MKMFAKMPPDRLKMGKVEGRTRGEEEEEREGESKGGEGKGRAPKLLLKQGPSEPCYATGHAGDISLTVCLFVRNTFCNGYLQRRLTQGDGIWQDGRSRSSALW